MLPLFAHMWRIGVNRLFHGLPALVAAIPTFSKSFIPRLGIHLENGLYW
jgi:hypothetical protein